MNREELFEHHKEITEDCLEIMKRKNNDYAGSDGKTPFANFEACEDLDICSTEQGFLVRIMDKIKRLITFTNSGELKVKDEPVDDAIKDIINYLILFSAYLKNKEEDDHEVFDPDKKVD